VLLSYDPRREHLDSLGVKTPRRGTPSTNMWRGLFYGEANTPTSARK
jgi:hypothetical protein